MAALGAACSPRNSTFTARTLPHPGGCFVQVWDQAHFNGASDFINGPRKYDTLRDLPGRRNWSNRIRSLTLGSTAAVTAWSDEGFRGKAVVLTWDSRLPQASLPVAPSIRSLAVSCDDEATRTVQTVGSRAPD